MRPGDQVDDPELGALVVVEVDGAELARAISAEDYLATPRTMGLGHHVGAVGLYLVPRT